MIVLHRSQMQYQTVTNLVTAGILRQEEADFYYELLSTMSMQDVVTALLDSHQLREDCPEPIFYYPIGEISKN